MCFFFVKFERIFKFTYRTGRFFCLGECHPTFVSWFGYLFLFDITRWSVICPVEFLVMYTERSLESTEIELFRLDSLVLGVRPKCNSNGVFFVSECIVNFRTYSALFTLSRRFWLPSKFASVRFFNDWIVRSTNPVPVCRFAVPYMRLILCVLQYSMYSLEIKAPPLSDFICFGTPYTFIYSSRNEITVSWFVFLHIFATGHRLFLSTAISMNGLLCSFLLLRFPVKSICISSPGVFGGSIFDFSVWGIWNFRFLPALRQAEQVFDFFSMSSRMFGHQNIAASLYILFIPGCPKCSALSAA